MCLIIFSPKGTLPDYEILRDANQQNNDGIGVMSARGVEKFLGRRQLKRAVRYMKGLSAESVPFGVHFRWATHGAVNRDNVHPFTVRDGVYLMHNGVLGKAGRDANVGESDTSAFCRLYLAGIADLRAAKPLIEYAMGNGNKFLVLDNGVFTLFNEAEGTWYEDSCWYSNDYALPGAYGFGYGNAKWWDKPHAEDVDADLAASGTRTYADVMAAWDSAYAKELERHTNPYTGEARRWDKEPGTSGSKPALCLPSPARSLHASNRARVIQGIDKYGRAYTKTVEDYGSADDYADSKYQCAAGSIIMFPDRESEDE